MMTRYDRAVEVRDAALAVIRRIGRFEVTGGRTPVRIVRADFGRLSIVHNGRFNPLPPVSDHTRYEWALDGKRICPYSLDIWLDRRKVFFACWDDTDPRMEIVTFVKGDWPALLQEPVLQ